MCGRLAHCRSRNVRARQHVPLRPLQAASTVETKQQAGNDALAAKKYGEALNAYDEALKALPERHALVAELHAKKASVYLADKKCASLHFTCTSPSNLSHVMDARA